MMTLTQNFNHNPISIVNYSKNLFHISSSAVTGLFQGAVNLDIDLIHTLCFCLI